MLLRTVTVTTSGEMAATPGSAMAGVGLESGTALTLGWNDRDAVTGTRTVGARRAGLTTGGVCGEANDTPWTLPPEGVAIRTLEVGLVVRRVLGDGRCPP